MKMKAAAAAIALELLGCEEPPEMTAIEILKDDQSQSFVLSSWQRIK